MNISPPWYRQFWPWFLMLPPAAAVIGGFITLWIAVEHADTLLPDRFSRVGIALQPDAIPGPTSATLSFRLDSERLYLRVSGETANTPLTLRWLHPTLPDRDQISILQPFAPGEYEARLPNGLREPRVLRLESQAGWVLEGRWRPGTDATRLVPLVSREG
ncbi:FixH family protein [Candidatus Macondimonas diazotrophica]|jgi:hypothetical protein|uniref:Nitrogen fixation protein FixH n=1 Tax=Candidatus Macondimonas diazotrophica TaxID=2305248 RepID=A0A4Z0FBY7_9GAMM|nr:FixH family protein [Candidatus Macondimonas diazotrophica]NCT99974.1 hypothetical protein [Candidatus Macondimonas diazotrophica]TFZ83771.1 hypothetical protein E4680_01965 [Candidatus Macondimonas diazotrophica]HBG30640.1 hypothetical protein [Gammaproteobacteria bacterium]